MKKIKYFTVFFLTLLFIQSIYSRGIICYNTGSEWKCYYHRDLDCNIIRDSKWVRCFGQVKLSKPPIIYVDKYNNAVISDNGNVIKIASDKFEKEFLKIAKINDEQVKDKLKVLLSNDNGFVSLKRLKSIGIDIKAKIKYVKRLPKINYCPTCEVAGM